MRIAKLVENTCHQLVDEYIRVSEQNKHNKQWVTNLQNFHNELNKQRRDQRNLELKAREAAILKQHNEKNRERLARKEKIVKLEGKKLMTRSPPPKLVNQKQKQEVNQEAVDIELYLGQEHAEELFQVHGEPGKTRS